MSLRAELRQEIEMLARQNQQSKMFNKERSQNSNREHILVQPATSVMGIDDTVERWTMELDNSAQQRGR